MLKLTIVLAATAALLEFKYSRIKVDFFQDDSSCAVFNGLPFRQHYGLINNIYSSWISPAHNHGTIRYNYCNGNRACCFAI